MRLLFCVPIIGWRFERSLDVLIFVGRKILRVQIEERNRKLLFNLRVEVFNHDKNSRADSFL